jgi:anaerobic magnesium-protoporphyrin IX monomethyl ester cyclase
VPKVTLASATLGEDRFVEPPLGPLYIAGALESIGWHVDLRDYQMVRNADAFDSDKFSEFLIDHERVLMISCFVDMLPLVIEASRKIKARRAEVLIILGGPGPSAGAKELMEAFPWIDGIVVGEGDETIREWAGLYETHQLEKSKASPVAGMVYRLGARIVEGPPRARITDQKKIAHPAYHLLDWSLYSGARITTTRGCPYHCSFCDVAPLWGRRAVYRELSETIDEMILLRDRYGHHQIAIVDDTFVLNRERVRAFCEMLLERNAGLIWGCFGRINLMSEPLIALMAQAGCRSIFYGIDSGSASVLAETAKEIDRNAILPMLELSARYFEHIEASFIWGYPNETLADFEQTVELAAEASLLSPTVNVQLHMLSPLPSAPIYKNFKGQLIAPDQRDRRWLLLPALLVDPRAAEVRKLVLEYPGLFPGFYTFPSPDLDSKREIMDQIFGALHRTLGSVMLQKGVEDLLDRDNRKLERQLLGQTQSNTDRIGTGLGLGVMKRARRNRSTKQAAGLFGARGASIVRERNDRGGQTAS